MQAVMTRSSESPCEFLNSVSPASDDRSKFVPSLSAILHLKKKPQPYSLGILYLIQTENVSLCHAGFFFFLIILIIFKKQNFRQQKEVPMKGGFFYHYFYHSSNRNI